MLLTTYSQLFSFFQHFLELFQFKKLCVQGEFIPYCYSGKKKKKAKKNQNRYKKRISVNIIDEGE